MTTVVLICGKLFDGVSETLAGPSEILVEDKRISQIERTVGRPLGAQIIDLSDRTVSPGFIDTHVHLTMDAANLAAQTLESSAAKALKGLSIAQQYMSFGFTTLRDLGSVDPEWPTVDLRDALNAGLVEGPRLVVAAHIISASAGHGDLRGFYASRWNFRFLRSPTTSGVLGRSCDVNTLSAATGSRPPTPAATSAGATIPRG